MKAYYEYLKLNPFLFIPYTFHVSAQQDLEEFEKVYNEKSETENNVWIVKPGEDSNRGNGIFVTS